jgi:hypothetical protein
MSTRPYCPAVHQRQEDYGRVGAHDQGRVLAAHHEQQEVFEGGVDRHGEVDGVGLAFELALQVEGLDPEFRVFDDDPGEPAGFALGEDEVAHFVAEGVEGADRSAGLLAGFRQVLVVVGAAELASMLGEVGFRVEGGLGLVRHGLRTLARRRALGKRKTNKQSTRRGRGTLSQSGLLPPPRPLRGVSRARAAMS